MTAEQKQKRIEELLNLIEDKEKDIEGLETGENIDGVLDDIIKEAKGELENYKKEIAIVENIEVQIPDIEEAEAEMVKENEQEVQGEIIDETPKWIPVSVNGDIEHLKEKVKLINEFKIKNQEILNASSTTESQRTKAHLELENINANVETLKLEITKEAFEKTKVEYNGEPIRPTELFGIYTLEKEKLEKERDELQAKFENETKKTEKRKSERKEQYKVAKEKYKLLLKNGKITEELYESRLENMTSAMTKDNLSYDKEIKSLSDRLDVINNKLVEVNDNVKEVNNRIKLREEYNQIYKGLYGEELIIEDNPRIVVQNTPGPGTSKITEAKVAGVEQSNQEEQKGQKEQEVEEEPQKIEIITKKQFKELYKKLNKGNITEQEMNALTKVLENKSNYKKFGVSTGLIFNKSKKILEASSNFLADDMEKFIKENSKFAEGVNYDEDVENGETFYTIGELRKWFNENELGETSNPAFGVEEYITRIEEYKESGNELSDSQKKQYKEAMRLKGKIEGYKKSLNSHRDISIKRRNDNMLNKLFGAKNNDRILPETIKETINEEAKGLEFAETLEDGVREEVEIKEAEISNKEQQKQIIDEEVR